MCGILACCHVVRMTFSRESDIQDRANSALLHSEPTGEKTRQELVADESRRLKKEAEAKSEEDRRKLAEQRLLAKEKSLRDAELAASRRLRIEAEQEARKRKFAEDRQLAKEFNDAIVFYAFYGFLDGLSLSYSFIKYFFDILYTNTSMSASGKMHEWMLTDAGFVLVSTETLLILILSTAANSFDEEHGDKESIHAWINANWPYVRDVIKALKNAFKGMQSLLLAVGLQSGADLTQLIVPLGIMLGIFSIVNRLWYRSMKEGRKTAQKANGALLKEIQDMVVFDEAKYADFCTRTLGVQSTGLRAFALLSAAYAGLVDGLYLYLAAACLVALSPTAFTLVLVSSITFAVLNVITRMYEEYDYQRKLIASQVNIELLLCGKKLENLYHAYNKLVDDSADVNLMRRLMKDLEFKAAEYEDKRQYLESLVTLSYTSAALAGLRNGLFAYSAFSSVMYAIAAINSMFLLPTIAPATLLFFVGLGIACVLGFLAYSLITTYQNEKQAEVVEENKMLNQIFHSIKRQIREIEDIQPVEMQEAILGGLIVDPSPQFFFQEWFEVVRSWFAGIRQGEKAINFALTALQEQDEHGDYHASTIMIWLTVIGSLFYSIGLALRAFANGFGKNVDKISSNEVKQSTSVDAVSPMTPKKNTEPTVVKPMLVKTAESPSTKQSSYRGAQFFPSITSPIPSCSTSSHLESLSPRAVSV